MSQTLRVIVAVALLAGLWTAAPAEAANNKWSTTGPFGGQVKALVVDPLDAEVVFAGIDGLGVFVSTDGGLNWGPVNTGLTDLRVQALAIDNEIPIGNIYAGTNGGGVFRGLVDMVTHDVTWSPVNGPMGDELTNLAVLSVAIHPDILDLDEVAAPIFEGLLFVGTNGGGMFRGQYDPGIDDVLWEPENLGLGNRVIFDVEIPQPQQSRVVINEVDADGSGAVDGTEGGEFIELFGPANTSLAGLSLVLFDGTGFPPPGPCPEDEFAYAAWDLDEVCGGPCVLDNNGFFVLGDDLGPGVIVTVPPEDGALPDPFEPGIHVLNTESSVSAAVALYLGDADDFLGEGPTGDSLLDVVVYQTGGGINDECFLTAFGLGGLHVNEAAPPGAEFNSIQRLPDGGLRADLGRWGATEPTPGVRNTTLTTIYAATDLEGVYRSIDLTTDTMVWAPLNNGLESDVVFSLAIDPVDPDVSCDLSSFSVYAGTSGQGVFRSTDPCNLDEEEDWNPVSDGLPANSTITAMTVAPVNSPIAPFTSAIYAGTELGEVFKSTDNGGSWEPRSNGLGGLRIDSLQIEPTVYPAEDPFRPSRLYAGTLGGGVYKSIDSASNWFVTSFDVAGIVGVFVEDVEVVPTAPFDVVYAATFGGGVFRSLDRGEDGWPELVNDGLPMGGPLFVNTLAVDPVTPTNLYLGTDLNGAFRSTIEPPLWGAMDITEGIDPPEPSILDIILDPSDPTTLYAVTGGLFQSRDSGLTWSNISNNDPVLNDAAIQAVAVNPDDPGIIYAGTQDRGLYRSFNADAADPDDIVWARIGLPSLTEDFIRAVAIDHEDPLTVYAGTDGGGMFKSVDGGEIWIERNNGLPGGLIVLTIRIDAENAQILYIGTDGDDPVNGGVFKTIDGGANWSPFNTQLTNFVVKDFEIAPRLDPMSDSQFLHAATFGGGVFDFEKEELFFIEPMTGLETDENGQQAFFNINLTRIPTASVIIGLESSDLTEGSVSPTALLFPPNANALVPQEVEITGVADGEIDSDQDYQVLILPAVSEDTDFDGVDPDDVSVINRDVVPMVPGVRVNPTSGLITTEDGGSDTFELSLRTVPTADVIITLESNDPTEGVISPTQLTFTPTNAMTPQEVTITGLQDGVVDGDQVYSVVASSVASADPEYDGEMVSPVSATNIDNGLETLFESADLGAIAQAAGTGPVVGVDTFLGWRFTVTETVTVANVGGHLVAQDAGPETLFVAIVPLEADGFPPDTSLTDDAVFGASFVVDSPSAEIAVPVGIVLDPGEYGMIFGSGLFGATGRGHMPGNDSDIDSPEYFFGDVPSGTYTEGGFSNTRFFVNGFLGIVMPEEIFSDAFESGDISAW